LVPYGLFLLLRQHNKNTFLQSLVSTFVIAGFCSVLIFFTGTSEEKYIYEQIEEEFL